MDGKLEYIKLYKDIQQNVENTIANLKGVIIVNKKSNQYVEDLKEKLDTMKTKFSDEIMYLEKHSEWEKFTIAFFGETNAGKSTILEALRILFSEKSRQEKILENKALQEDYAKSYIEQVENLQNELLKLFEETHDTSFILANDVAEIKRIFEDEHQKLIKENKSLGDDLSCLNEEKSTLQKEHDSLQKRFELFQKIAITTSAFSVILILWMLISRV